jgi:lysozyme
VLVFRRLFSVACVLEVLVASAATSAALSQGPAGQPDRHRYPVRGIDVSHYQGTIDWPTVARHDVAFAYVKATEGVDGRDAQFVRNWRGAQRAGIRVGAYHYFIFCRSPRSQARNFLAVASRRASALPPAVDLEPPRSCPAGLTGREMRKQLDAYLAVVEARERRPAILYTTPQFFGAYRGDLPKRPLWRRSILSTPTPAAAWKIWQYRSRGEVAGVPTFVDLNVLNDRTSAGPPAGRRSRQTPAAGRGPKPASSRPGGPTLVSSRLGS